MIQMRDIPGYEGIYEAHADGTIWTCKGKTTYSNWNGKVRKRVWKQRQIKPKFEHRNRSSFSDERVELWKNKQHSTKIVSRLVAAAFIPNPIDLPCVNHIDGNPLNNTPSNLEWCTYKHNTNHAFENNLNHNHKKIQLIDKSNVTTEFESMAKASIFLGRNPGYISGVLKRNREIPNYKIKII